MLGESAALLKPSGKYSGTNRSSRNCPENQWFEGPSTVLAQGYCLLDLKISTGLLFPPLAAIRKIRLQWK